MRGSWILALVVCGGIGRGQIVINEFVYDDAGSDDREFVELYNAGAAAVDLGGYRLVSGDLLGPSWAFPIVFAAGTMIPAGGFYVVGSAGVPRVNRVVPTGFLEDDNEGIVLYDPAGLPVDRVGYEVERTVEGPLPASLREGSGIHAEFESATAVMSSLGRYVDGFDTDDNALDFGMLLPTPGESNVPARTLPFLEDFETRKNGTELRSFSGSRRRPRIVDPTVLGAFVPVPVPTSPDGGFCLAAMTLDDDGTTFFLGARPEADVILEAWVYFFAGHSGPDVERWAIGLRGSGDMNFRAPGPGGITDHGGTGIVLDYVSDASGGRLRLVDEGAGGPGGTILGTIAVAAGLNDGWQRLRFVVAGTSAIVNFGGSFGDPGSGTILSATLAASPRPGNLWLGYRESAPAVGQLRARGLLLDRLVVTTPGVTVPDALYEPRDPMAQLESGGIKAGRYSKAKETKCLNTPMLVAMSTSSATTPFDLGIVPAALVPAGGGGLVTADGQVVNLDLAAAGGLSWLFGGAGPNLATPTVPSPIAVAFTTPNQPMIISAQLLAIAPAMPSGVALSEALEIESARSAPLVIPTSEDDAEFTIDVTRAPLCAPPVRFYGTAWTTIHVQTNGRVVFGGAGGGNTFPIPTVWGALSSRPFVGAWNDFSPGPESAITLSRQPDGRLRVAWTRMPYWGLGYESDVYVEFDPSNDAVLIGDLDRLAVTSIQWMFVGMSPGGQAGATDPGFTWFGPAPQLGLVTSPTDMIYANGGAVPVVATKAIGFLPNAFGNYDWISFP